MKIYSPLLVLLSIFVGVGYSQSPVLDAYVQEGLQANLSMDQHQLELLKSKERLRQARAYFLPQLSFEASYTRAGGGRAISFPVGDLLNPVYGTLNDLTESNNFSEIENVEEQFLPNDFHDTRLRVVQPLINTDIWYQQKAREHLVSAEEARKGAFENDLKHSIRESYYRYLQAHDAVEIYTSTRPVLEELLRVNQKLVSNQKATVDIVYRAEAELSQLDADLIEAQKTERVAQAYFNFLLNRPLDSRIEIDSTLSSTQPTLQATSEFSALALNNRKELTQVESALRANESLLQLQQANMWLPQVNLFVDAGYQGFGYEFDNTQDYWLGGLNLSWSIFKGGEKQAQVREARYEVERLNSQQEQLRKQIELQAITASRELQAAREAEIAARKESTSTQKSFNIIRKKYRENQVMLVEFLEAQNATTAARLKHNIAAYEVLVKQSEIQKVTAI